MSSTHCSPKRTGLIPPLQGRKSLADKTSTRGNDMHGYRLHAHAVDQCRRWGHVPNGAGINREVEAAEVWGCVHLCRNKVSFWVGGLLLDNFVSPALCLPINWTCVFPPRQAAKERLHLLQNWSSAFMRICLFLAGFCFTVSSQHCNRDFKKSTWQLTHMMSSNEQLYSKWTIKILNK